tara:strand:- start:501 stop:947 length:447 start_codon:yes stop_codon:yes gene_type:complete
MAFSVLCQLNGGCMGCCGHSFPSNEKIKEAVKKNSQEFEEINPISKDEFKMFRDRESPGNLRNQVCRNLIVREGQFFCPLHPNLHDQEDLRKGHCEPEYLCKTAQKFSLWDKKKQRDFIEFIDYKKMDNVTFSVRMDLGMLLKEFEEN